MAELFERKTHVVNAEVIEGLGDLNLLGGVEESIRELLSLAQCRFDDLEARDIAQKVADARVWVVLTVNVRVGSGLDAGVSSVACNDVVNSDPVWIPKHSEYSSPFAPLDEAPFVAAAGAATCSGSHEGHILTLNCSQ